MNFKPRRLQKLTLIARKIISLMILFSMAALASVAFAEESKNAKVPTKSSAPNSPPDSKESPHEKTMSAEAIKTAIGPELNGFASVEAGRIDLGSLGQVLIVDGAGSVMRTKGNVDKLEHDTLLFVGDRIQLTSQARAVIRLNDARFEKNQSVITLFGGSTLIMEEAKADGPENLRDVHLTLETGELRAQVPPASDPVLPTFHVKLPTSQVNLKSGDAWIHIEQGNGKLHSRVVMLDGTGTLLTERSVDGKKDYVDIPAHQWSEFTQGAVPAGASRGQFQQLIDKGDFTEPAEAEAGLIAKIEKSSNVAGDVKKQNADAAQALAAKTAAEAKAKKEVAQKRSAKAKASEAAAHLCQSPGGQYNQCAWTCTGKNPKGAKSCRTDVTGVSCVRTICRADGEWKEETRLPASQSDMCPAKGSVVHECGNYW